MFICGSSWTYGTSDHLQSQMLSPLPLKQIFLGSSPKGLHAKIVFMRIKVNQCFQSIIYISNLFHSFISDKSLFGSHKIYIDVSHGWEHEEIVQLYMSPNHSWPGLSSSTLPMIDEMVTQRIVFMQIGWVNEKRTSSFDVTLNIRSNFYVFSQSTNIIW